MNWSNKIECLFCILFDLFITVYWQRKIPTHTIQHSGNMCGKGNMDSIKLQFHILWQNVLPILVVLCKISNPPRRTLGQKKVLFPEISRVKYIYHLSARIVKCVSEYFLLQKKKEKANKKQKKWKKNKEKRKTKETKEEKEKENVVVVNSICGKYNEIRQ